jgi:hypothetical protein
MSFTDQAGHRFQVFITDQPDPDAVALEAHHRGHARVEDRIRGAKATGRYRLWHTAGRLVRHGRRLILCLQRSWPWTQELVAAFGRLRALPAPC